jgi:hypothetical protein
VTNPSGGPPSEPAVAAATRLRIDAATAEVLRALDREHVRTRLLKGAAFGEWYDSNPTWSYLDCDLWVHPGDLSACERALEHLDFARDFDQRTLPEWWREHATSWSRAADAVTVDLHQTLQGIGVDAGRAWEILCTQTDEIEVAGYTAPRLPEAGRALYATLHAAHHGRAWGKALMHLKRALEVVDESSWREAAALAALLKASDAFAAGLRLVPAGFELAARLGVGASTSVVAVLHAETPPPTALGFAQLADAAGFRARSAILAHKLFPPPAFIRHWWPPAQRSPLLLFVGPLYRPLWLVRSARRGLPAWLRARRRVRH